LIFLKLSGKEFLIKFCKGTSHKKALGKNCPQGKRSILQERYVADEKGAPGNLSCRDT
jgi:hypothetical protein